MTNIDFLPERYRQAKKRRLTSYWRLAVTLLFIAVFAAAAGGLYVKQQEVRTRSQNTNMQYAAAQAQSSLLTNKQAELAKLNVYASLLTHLRRPWPKSRLLHELISTLPAEVTLTQLRLHSVPRENLAKSESPAADDSAETTARTLEADLAELQRRADEEELLISLEGSTHDQTALHIYLQSLASSKLFQGAELTSIEAVGGEQAAREDRFVAVVKVRPAWGSAGGPQDESPEETPPPVQVTISASGAGAAHDDARQTAGGPLR